MHLQLPWLVVGLTGTPHTVYPHPHPCPHVLPPRLVVVPTHAAPVLPPLPPALYYVPRSYLPLHAPGFPTFGSPFTPVGLGYCPYLLPPYSWFMPATTTPLARFTCSSRLLPFTHAHIAPAPLPFCTRMPPAGLVIFVIWLDVYPYPYRLTHCLGYPLLYLYLHTLVPHPFYLHTAVLGPFIPCCC